jgi:hypothetical protein
LFGLRRRTDMMIDVFNDTFVEHSGRFKVIDLNPQSYSGEYGPRRENMADLPLSCSHSNCQ